MKTSKGKLYLIPNLLGESASIKDSIPMGNLDIIKQLDIFAVEHIKDTRRYFVKLGLKEKIDQSRFIEINKHSTDQSNQQVLEVLEQGASVGIISDAGCPAIADPGSDLCLLAHTNDIEVLPLIGPSSIFLALMSSGFNGQSFAFNGYLNRKPELRQREIKKLEQKVIAEMQTQIFMETPYRNESLLKGLLEGLKNSTKLCIAANIGLNNQYIKSMNVASWKKKQIPSLNKIPVVYLLSS